MATKRDTNALICVRKSPIHGRGVFASQVIRRGARIGRFEGVPTQRDGCYVLWVPGDDDEFHGIRGTSQLRFLNHSSRPNAEFRDVELFALRTIRSGEEITCHYGEAWEDEPVTVKRRVPETSRSPSAAAP